MRFFSTSLMKYLELNLVLLFCSITVTQAQNNLICEAEDSLQFKNIVTIAKSAHLESISTGSAVAFIGTLFLDKPYVAKTLEVGSDDEPLVVNLRGLDCTTFVESVLALAITFKKADYSFKAYTKELERVRYRDGKRKGYPSRLHYFSDWIANNEKKGVVTNITGEIGGKKTSRVINFMSSHPDYYPFITGSEDELAILSTEKKLSNQEFPILEKEDLCDEGQGIKHGDIIALTVANVDGLDVHHTGIAFRKADGKLYLLHASSIEMKVVISETPLNEIIQKKRYSGIMVAHPN